MPMIQVPNSFRKFILEYEHWRHEWKAWALVETKEPVYSTACPGYTKPSDECFWYMATGANPDLASKELFKKIERGEKHSTLEKPSASIASTSKGFRNLEKAREEKERNSTPLEDLF